MKLQIVMLFLHHENVALGYLLINTEAVKSNYLQNRACSKCLCIFEYEIGWSVCLKGIQ